MSMDGIKVRDGNAVSVDGINVNGKKRMPYEREGKKQGFFNERDDMQIERERGQRWVLSAEMEGAGDVGFR